MGSRAATSAAGQVPARESAAGAAHLWVPRLGGDPAALLLALAADRDSGHPDNATATGRMLGVHRDTVRRWRAELVAAGLVESDGRYLRTKDAGRAMMRRGCDPLPRPLIRGPGPRPTPAVLLAVAVVYSDAVGWRADRHGCRTDAERAGLAGVSRETVLRARTELARRGLATVAELRRGRADLRRVRLTEDRCATHGRPMAAARADVLAERARCGRARPGGGAVSADSRGAVSTDTPKQCPTGIQPQQAPPAPTEPRNGSAAPESRDGAQNLPAIAIGQDGRPVRRDPVAVEATARQGLRALLVDDDRRTELLRRAPVAAILELLDVAGYEWPHRRQQVARDLARATTADYIARVCADVLLGSPRSLGGVLRTRIGRILGGHAAGAMTHGRRPLSLDELAEMLVGRDPAADRRRPDRRTGTTPEPRDHAEHPSAIALREGIVTAARAGQWRTVVGLLRTSVAAERGWTGDHVATWIGDPGAIAAIGAERAAAAARASTLFGGGRAIA